MRKKKTSYNWYKILLCGLVFFVIGGTVFCMIAESKESAEKRKQRREDEKTHAYYKCPECKKELRVPRGKGKIRITCPHCGHQFVKRT